MSSQTIQAKAVVFPSAGQVELREITLHDLHDDEILTQTLFSGVSPGTESWVLQGKRDDVEFPCIPGYQNIGRVIAMGEKAAANFNLGDLVMQAGFSRMPKGLSSGCGSCHASHLIGSAQDAVVLDPSIDPQEAALSWIAGCSLEGVTLTRIVEGDQVVVIGQGLIGQMAAQIARAQGAHVTAIELKPNRLALSKAHSAHEVIDPSTESISERLAEIYPDGATVAIEATGNRGLINTAISTLRHGGRLCLQGWYPDDVCFHFHSAHMKEVSILMPCAWGWAKGLRGSSNC